MLDGWSCQKCSSDGEFESLRGGLRYRRRAGDGSSSDGGGRLSSVSSGAKENTDRVRKSSGGMTGCAAIEDIVWAADLMARRDAVRFERNVEVRLLRGDGRVASSGLGVAGTTSGSDGSSRSRSS
jgi:hypothetical protein